MKAVVCIITNISISIVIIIISIIIMIMIMIIIMIIIIMMYGRGLILRRSTSSVPTDPAPAAVVKWNSLNTYPVCIA